MDEVKLYTEIHKRLEAIMLTISLYENHKIRKEDAVAQIEDLVLQILHPELRQMIVNLDKTPPGNLASKIMEIFEEIKLCEKQ